MNERMDTSFHETAGIIESSPSNRCPAPSGTEAAKRGTVRRFTRLARDPFLYSGCGKPAGFYRITMRAEE